MKIKEELKTCGVDKETIENRINEIPHEGVVINIVEDCLDATIFMESDLEYNDFSIIKSKIYGAFEDEVYACEDITLEALCGKLLKLNKKVLAVAESLTGGEVCSRLVTIPGISQNFYEGVVAYDTRAKHETLMISSDILDKYGAISKQTAYAMVESVTRSKNVNLGLSTTGNAGPSGDEGKPVGLVYIGVGYREFIVTFEHHLTGSRQEIRNKTSNLALFYLSRYLKNNILRFN